MEMSPFAEFIRNEQTALDRIREAQDALARQMETSLAGIAAERGESTTFAVGVTFNDVVDLTSDTEDDVLVTVTVNEVVDLTDDSSMTGGVEVIDLTDDIDEDDEDDEDDEKDEDGEDFEEDEEEDEEDEDVTDFPADMDDDHDEDDGEYHAIYSDDEIPQ